MTRTGVGVYLDIEKKLLQRFVHGSWWNDTVLRLKFDCDIFHNLFFRLSCSRYTKWDGIQSYLLLVGFEEDGDSSGVARFAGKLVKFRPERRSSISPRPVGVFCRLFFSSFSLDTTTLSGSDGGCGGGGGGGGGGAAAAVFTFLVSFVSFFSHNALTSSCSTFSHGIVTTSRRELSRSASACIGGGIGGDGGRDDGGDGGGSGGGGGGGSVEK